VTGKHLVQQGQHALVGKQHLPRGLDRDEARGFDMRAEIVLDEPGPRIELEERADRPVVGIEELLAVPADGIQIEAHGLEPGRARGRGEEVERQRGFGVVGRTGEMHGQARQAETAPRLDEPAFDLVELQGTRDGERAPFGLEARGLDEGDGRFGVVFEKSGRAARPPGEVEAADQVARLPVPRIRDEAGG
jgi:hypothetical protein